MLLSSFDEYFQNTSPLLDLAPVRDSWLALTPTYQAGDWILPLPPWRHRPYSNSGEQAWTILRRDLARAATDKPFCIYLHAPFCSAKCGFCDNYSFKLGNQQQEHITAYVDQLCAELRLWSQQGNLSQRPVSTVHMGGGTPTFLGAAALEQIAACCRECFAISDETEWALESTAHDLTPEVIATMHQIGYRRLHIGVQTLEDAVRAAIGRRSRAGDVLNKIESVLALGWVVSVDLICGLPGQTLDGFLAGIDHLIRIGVHGFSLYELLVYPQNQRWAARHGLVDPDRHQLNFWMFLAGAHLLEQRGFKKNLFNHWANEQDKNIYFTFPTRNEDLLAIGTIADGIFGDYRYRHPRYADYLRSASATSPGLEGGLLHNAYEKRLSPYVTDLLSARGSTRFAAMVPQLMEIWHQHGLITLQESGAFDLTPSGSWFTGNMIDEVYQQIR